MSILSLDQNQFKNQRESSLYKAMGKNQRALPSQPSVPRPQAQQNASPAQVQQDWKRRAELAEEKAKLMEDKIKNLAIAVKADRDKSRKVIDEWKVQADSADAKALAFETKLHEAVTLLKKERSKTLSSQSEMKSMMDDLVAQKAKEQADERLAMMRTELIKEREINAQQKSEIQYLAQQVEDLKSQLARAQPSQEQKAPQKRNVLVALFDCPPPQTADDLNFSEGEAFYLVKKISKDWWIAEKNGKQGRVPREYVEELDIANRSTVRAMGDFKAENKKDLSFSSGELMLAWITQDDWWVGENSKHELGWAPSNYFEEI